MRMKPLSAGMALLLCASLAQACLPCSALASRFTALFIAIGNHNLEATKKLTPSGAAINSTDEASGATPLTWAAQCGTPEIVSWLIEAGADIEARDKLDMTPLITAAEAGNLAIFTLLMEKGADLSARTFYGKNSLHAACGSKGSLDLVRCIYERGVDLNLSDKYGATPISWAVKRGKRDIALFLLEMGANPAGDPAASFSPLHLAVKGGDLGLVQELVRRGANVNAPGARGSTPLTYAADAAIRDFLLQNGAQ